MIKNWLPDLICSFTIRREETGSTFKRDEGPDLNEVASEELCFVLKSSSIMN